nr:MAG TPA: hypothetical protein [Caudoviricetes sp.]
MRIYICSIRYTQRAPPNTCPKGMGGLRPSRYDW